MIENRSSHSFVPTWWTIFRAFVILNCGIGAAIFIIGLPRSATSTTPRVTSDDTLIHDLFSLEIEVGRRLQQNADDLQSEIDTFSCQASDQIDTSGVRPPQFNGALSGAALQQLIDQSVVYIRAGERSGTGFFVAPGIIVTNAHVVDSANLVDVYSNTLFPNTATGQVLARTRESTDSLADRDYAIIQVTPPSAAVPLALVRSAAQLDPVVSAGFPGIFQTFHQSSLPRMILRRGEFIDALPQSGGREVYAHSAEVFAGNSGGPLLNICGSVIGINTFIIWATSSAESDEPEVKTDFALPASDLSAFLQENGVSVSLSEQSCSP